MLIPSCYAAYFCEHLSGMAKMFSNFVPVLRHCPPRVQYCKDSSRYLRSLKVKGLLIVVKKVHVWLELSPNKKTVLNHVIHLLILTFVKSMYLLLFVFLLPHVKSLINCFAKK